MLMRVCDKFVWDRVGSGAGFIALIILSNSVNLGKGEILNCVTTACCRFLQLTINFVFDYHKYLHTHDIYCNNYYIDQ